MQISIIDENRMPPDLDAAIRGGLCRCFPPDVPVFSHTRAWHGSLPEYTVVACDGPTVAGHLGVVGRAISVGGQPLRAAGVQNVYVLPEYRGRQLTALLSQAAMDEAARRRYDVGLLFCVAELERVYAACHWQGLGRRDVVRVEDGREIPLPGKNITMVYPLARAHFPAGLIHLGGNDW